MHPHASRTSRRFAWPTLVFNAREQFEHLGEKSQFNGLQRQIRSREIELDGSINANLADFGYRRLAMSISAALSTIAPQSGVAFELARGEELHVVDPLGEQVADLLAFDRSDRWIVLSSGRTIDYANTIYLTQGHVLYSNRITPLFTIVHDDVGRHDFLLTPCSPESFAIISNEHGPHPSCFGNLCTQLAPFGILPDQISRTFTLFRNVEMDANGTIAVRPPR